MSTPECEAMLSENPEIAKVFEELGKKPRIQKPNFRPKRPRLDDGYSDQDSTDGSDYDSYESEDYGLED